ncbi:MAG: NAD(P)/FAD-dependent oxidoreductase [Microthrixaceae bacterium]|nr:NAD(P)/FAD-dependent oxidoreductase [Microthrixaceae bacterium]
MNSESDPVAPTAEPAAPSGDVVIIGAGPAGLTAAYQLGKVQRHATVLESDDIVGGISRTVERNGWRFDIGGHRFFTKVPEVSALWHEILPQGDFLLRPRKSRIFYNGKYFDYPLKAMNALTNLGPIEAIKCVASYAVAQVRPPKDQDNYEGWLVARFGWRLYRTFFKTYTEKVWGVPVSSMPADWAAQRIKNLSLFNAIVNALLPNRNQKDIASLIEEFEYPKFGPGMMWERCTDLVTEQGGDVIMQTRVVEIRHSDGVAHTVVAESTDGARTEYPAEHVISSMPMPALLRSMDPPVDEVTRRAADDLQFRDFLTVALVVKGEETFDDNWIYIHDPNVKVGRIQNFRSWSPYMVKDGYTCLGLEYFVFEGDGMWTSTDEDLIELAKRELAILGLADPALITEGYVVRMPKAYPTYDEHYAANVEVMKAWLAANATNVHPVGRNGMHKYNNADHSMLTAMLTVENIAQGAHHDIWAVNVEEEYHEEKAASSPQGTGRDAPVIPSTAPSLHQR